MTSPAAALHDSPAVAIAREALDGSQQAWIVGGAVRDALAARQVVDLDLAVGGDPAEAARRIADGPAAPRSSSRPSSGPGARLPGTAAGMRT